MLAVFYNFFLDALYFSERIHADVAEGSKGKLMNGCIALVGVCFGGGKLFESGSQTCSQAKFDAWVVGEEMFEANQKIDDEVLFLGLFKFGVFEERFHYFFSYLLVAEDISSHSAQHYPADCPANRISHFQLFIKKKSLETCVCLFAHFGQSFVGGEEESEQEGGLSADADYFAVAEGGGKSHTSLLDHVAWVYG